MYTFTISISWWYVKDRDLNEVSSKRRNYILADVFLQLNFMEKRAAVAIYERYVVKLLNY